MGSVLQLMCVGIVLFFWLFISYNSQRPGLQYMWNFIIFTLTWFKGKKGEIALHLEQLMYRFSRLYIHKVGLRLQNLAKPFHCCLLLQFASEFLTQGDFAVGFRHLQSYFLACWAMRHRCLCRSGPERKYFWRQPD